MKFGVRIRRCPRIKSSLIITFLVAMSCFGCRFSAYAASAVVTVTHSNGNTTVYTPVSETNTANAAALQNAFNNATPGDAIVLSSGTYDFGSSTIVIPANIDISGQGKTQTTIRSIAATSDFVAVYVNNQDYIHDLSIDVLPPPPFFSFITPQSANQTVYFYNVLISGGSDGLFPFGVNYNYKDNVKWYIDNSEINTAFDALNVKYLSNSLILFHNTTFSTTNGYGGWHPVTGNPYQTRGVGLTNATSTSVRLYNSHIVSSGNGVVDSRGTVCSIFYNSTMSSDKDDSMYIENSSLSSTPGIGGSIGVMGDIVYNSRFFKNPIYLYNTTGSNPDGSVASYIWPGLTSSNINTVATSSDSMLGDLSVSSGSLSPRFMAILPNYTDNIIDNASSSVVITPTADQANATITVDGNVVASGSATPVALSIGSNTVNIVVTAQDGVNQNTYTVTFNVAPSNDATLSSLTASDGTLSPTFSASTTSYTDLLPYGAAIVPTISAATNDPNATSTIAQASDLTGSTTVTVTAQDGATQNTYTVTFNVAAAITTGGGTSGSSYYFPAPVAPVGGFSLLINNGALKSSTPAVILKLKAGSDVARMAISNFSDFRNSAQESYAPEKNWNLCWESSITQRPLACPAGVHQVYTKFFTSYGQGSPVATSSIILGTSVLVPSQKIINTLTKDLKLGSKDKQVAQLQDILKRLGLFPKTVKTSNIFGGITLKAVQAFQTKYGVSKSGVKGYGKVEASTRKELNRIQ